MIRKIQSSELSGPNNQDIYELNLLYLMAVRGMARVDVSDTALRSGLDQSLVQALADSSVDMVRKIADPTMLQFKMRASNQLRSILRNEGAGSNLLLNAVSLISEAAGHE